MPNEEILLLSNVHVTFTFVNLFLFVVSAVTSHWLHLVYIFVRQYNVFLLVP